MHVAVLGAGVVGVTTAYYLSEQGHSVTLVDRAATVASATSFANGGQLSYSYTDTLARPEFVPRIPGLVLGCDPAIRVKSFPNFMMFGWGIDFLAQCTAAKARDNTVAVLKIALRSAELIDELQQRLGLDFSYAKSGKLVILDSDDDVRAATEKRELKRRHGCETRIVSPEEAVALEPALAAMTQDFAGAVYSERDEVGDAHAFSVGLVDWLQANRGLTLRLEENITGLVVENRRLHGVRTDDDVIHADAAVVCLGPWSPGLLKPHGIDPNIYPVRGYSVTLPAGRHAPTVSITNLRHRIVYSRLHGEVRVAGFADFVGYDTHRDPERLAAMLEIAEAFAPEAADYSVADKHCWGGFRPVTPSSRPEVGSTKVKGLFLNTGHGVLGWTLACATAHDVAGQVTAAA